MDLNAGPPAKSPALIASGLEAQPLAREAALRRAEHEAQELQRKHEAEKETKAEKMRETPFPCGHCGQSLFNAVGFQIGKEVRCPYCFKLNRVQPDDPSTPAEAASKLNRVQPGEASTTTEAASPTQFQKETAMNSIRVSSDHFGRSIKKALEHLQRTHADSNFGYSDLPPLDEDYLTEAESKLTMFRMSGGMVLESGGDMAKSSILKELKDAHLIETTGYKEFKLTPKGRQTTVHF